MCYRYHLYSFMCGLLIHTGIPNRFLIIISVLDTMCAAI